MSGHNYLYAPFLGKRKDYFHKRLLYVTPHPRSKSDFILKQIKENVEYDKDDEYDFKFLHSIADAGFIFGNINKVHIMRDGLILMVD